jgi:hypothetical protein
MNCRGGCRTCWNCWWSANCCTNGQPGGTITYPHHLLPSPEQFQWRRPGGNTVIVGVVVDLNTQTSHIRWLKQPAHSMPMKAGPRKAVLRVCISWDMGVELIIMYVCALGGDGEEKKIKNNIRLPQYEQLIIKPWYWAPMDGAFNTMSYNVCRWSQRSSCMQEVQYATLQPEMRQMPQGLSYPRTIIIYGWAVRLPPIELLMYTRVYERDLGRWGISAHIGCTLCRTES